MLAQSSGSILTILTSFPDARTEELDARYHRLLIEAFGLRQAADYSAAPEVVGEEDAEHVIREGKEFLSATREYIWVVDEVHGPTPEGWVLLHYI